MKHLFPNEKRKALTLSYDDGVEADVRLVNLLNKYGIKATFNLNSGIQTSSHTFNMNGYSIARLPKETVLYLYTGHEVAIHSLTHPPLETLDKLDVFNELNEDKRHLETWFNTEMLGMAYPFGTYSKDVLDVMNSLDIKYGRTVEDTFTFRLPTNFLLWHPTCHHNHAKLMTLADQFLDDDTAELKLFYLWGHSYEFDIDNNWNIIEAFCEKLSDHESIWYATNGEIMSYLEAANNLILDDSTITNNSSISIWFEHNDCIYNIPANSSLTI